MKFLKDSLPYLAIAIIVIIIGLLNYKPGTIITGWDNLHPEFNFLLNIKRSIFSVWQEYQSLGLLGGMGHAADLVRQIFLFLVSSVVPTHFIRFFWTLLTLFLGGIGALTLSKTIITNSFLGDNKTNKAILPTFTGLFYILNLATLQSYYTPFETFTAHFAFLPWMILASLHFFNRQSVKNALLLLLVFFLTTPQSYVPTLFVVFSLAMTVILAVAGIRLVKEGRIKKLFTMSIKYYAILFISNAFWLLPFLYFTFKNSYVNVSAKINQMATDQIILQNKEFGNVFDVMLLKGFWFNAIEPNLNRISTYIMEPWRTHMADPVVTVIGFSLFGLILFGLLSAIRKREILLASFSVLFLLVFSILASETPPFSYIHNTFVSLPLFSQAFRFPFTKLSILAGLLYALFATIGLGTLIIILRKKLLQGLAVLTVTIALLIYMLPIFNGHFFYEKEQLKLPNEYTKVFSYFDALPSYKRIVTLPMNTFWSWNYYTWGYGGSGFLWYGIKQPIIDRAFDVWGTTSENSYNEISYALYSRDKESLIKVLNKFQISYLLLDKNIYSNSTPKSLFYKEIESILSEIPSIRKGKEFGNISIYSVKLANETKNFVSTTPLLPSTNAYEFNNDDKAIKDLVNYKNANETTNYYPFFNLFTNKLKSADFEVFENKDEVTFSAKLKEDEGTITLPEWTEESVPARITSKYDPITQTSVVTAEVILPEVVIGEKIISNSQNLVYPLFVAPTETLYSIAVNNVRLTGVDLKKNQSIKTYLLLSSDNYFTLSDQNSDQVFVQSIAKNYLNSFDGLKKKVLKMDGLRDKEIRVTFPKVIDQYHGYSFTGEDFSNLTDCNNTREGVIKSFISSKTLSFESTNDSSCASKDASDLVHSVGYLTTVKAKNMTGRPLHFWVLNNNQGTTPIDIYLDRKGTSHFIVPPQKTDGIGYSLHVDNISIGNKIVKNILSEIEIVRIPYDFIKGITISKPFNTYPTNVELEVKHPNESLYEIEVNNKTGQPFTLVLGQSYDTGWRMFGPGFKEVKTHIKVNNWANGWEIESGKYTIVYVPQVLQFLGFIGLALTLITLTIIQLRKSDAYFRQKTNDLKRKF